MKKCLFLFFFITAISVFSQNKESVAIKLYEEKSLEASRKLFQEVSIEEPDNANVQEYLGNIAFDMQEYEKAANFIKPLMEKYPNVARYHFKYAGAIGLYAKNHRMQAVFLIDDIKEHFHKAVDLDETFVDARLGLVHLYLELPGILGGSKQKALFYAKEIQELDVKAGAEAMRLITAAD